MVSPAAVGRRRLRIAIVAGFGIADILVLVFDLVAGRSRHSFAASDALFREPRRRPAGLPDCPGWNSRLRLRQRRHKPVAHRISRRWQFLIYIS